MSESPAQCLLEMAEIACGLRFPEGPVSLEDGSVLLVEMQRQTLSRVMPDGSVEIVAHLGGGPNGAAIGPDGACYVCNNGGHEWFERGGFLFPTRASADYGGGSIQRVDLQTGKVSTLYTHCGGERLKAPNDLVFDAQGGFWFTDHGKTHQRHHDLGSIYYAQIDGSGIDEVVFPINGPNGIGLSPNETTLLATETHTARIWSFTITAPGKIGVKSGPSRVEIGQCLAGLPGYQNLDSLAIEEHGNICVATLIAGCITVVTPAGKILEVYPVADRFPTNICFGGSDMCDAFIALGGTGKLVRARWPRPGLRLLHQR